MSTSPASDDSREPAKVVLAMTGFLRTTVLVSAAMLLAAMPTLADNPAGTPEQNKMLYALQEKCGKDAAALFDALFFDKARTNGLLRRGSNEQKGESEFQNHYSTTFNKCFMWTYTTLIDRTTMRVHPNRQRDAGARHHHHVAARRLRHVGARRHHRRPIRTHQLVTTKELMTVWDVNDNRLIANFVILEQNKNSHELEPHAAWCWVVKPEKLGTFDPLASLNSINVNLCSVPSEGSDVWLQWSTLIKPYMQDSR